MNDQSLFKNSCIQIILSGERGSDGSLTINGHSYEHWPETITVAGQVFTFADEERDSQLTGTTAENAGKPEDVRGFYDYDREEEPEEEVCGACGEPMDDRDCNGTPRCETCDPPCPMCDDGGGPL
jgi:hypothetical protein